MSADTLNVALKFEGHLPSFGDAIGIEVGGAGRCLCVIKVHFMVEYRD